MAAKIFWGVSGLSIGLWLLPGMAVAEALEQVAPDQVLADGIADATADRPAALVDRDEAGPIEVRPIDPPSSLPDPVAPTSDSVIVSPITASPTAISPMAVSPMTASRMAADLQSDQPLSVGVEPVGTGPVSMDRSIDPAPAKPEFTPAASPATQSKSDRAIDPTAPPLPHSPTPSPHLYGELPPTPDIPPAAADPLEQWSDAEWMQLLTDEGLPEDTNLPPDPSITNQASITNQPLAAPVSAVAAPVNPFDVEFLDWTDDADTVIGQVTSVSQLADVQPTDWAYQALQSLVERYGVIQGYSDGMFRGDRALTRFEFAAGVNAAMDRVSELIANSSKDAVTQSDLAVLRRLQEDFSTELITLRGRVDGLDARVANLEAQQFSTTVVLNGQVTFGLADAWGGEPPGLGETNPVFAYLAQLQLAGSFSENDAFRIDLESGNFSGGGFAEPAALNTQMALLGFQTDTGNDLEMSGAEYRFAVGDRLVVTLKPVGFSLSTILTPNSLFSSVSQGALSRFAAETPIFKIGSLDSGLGLDWLMTDRLRLQLAYGARNAGDPVQGLLRSDHRALGVQLLARPASTVTTGIAYVNAFADDGFLDTFTGSTNADTSGGFLEPAAIHAVSGTLQWQIVPSVVLGAWGGLTVTDSLESDAVALSTTYQFSLAFPDTFGREGDLLGVIVGQPLRLRYGLLIEREDEASGLHYELFYRIRVNDHIAVTPAVFIVTDPGHVPNNNTIVVGALRTSFSF